MLPETQQQIQLVSRPEGMPVKEDFLYKEIEVPKPSKEKYLSRRFTFPWILTCAEECLMPNRMLNLSN